MSEINLLLNSSHFQRASGKLIYRFPTAVQMANKEVSLNSTTFYHSFRNVSAEIGNNQMTLLFPVFTGANTYTMTSFVLTLPDGYYTIDDLDNALQNLCLLNGLYCVETATGRNVYFIQLQQNATRYAYQINSFYVPTAAQAGTLGWTSGGMTLNTGNLMVAPRLTIPAAMSYMLGIPGATYPGSVLTSTAASWPAAAASATLSTVAPQIDRVTAVIFRTSLVNNAYSLPSDLLAQVPVTASFGAAVQYSAQHPLWSAVPPRQFAQIEVSLADQDGNLLNPYDSQITCVLAIRDQRK